VISRVNIRAAAVVSPGPDGQLSDALLIKERRNRKVGALPVKARMVLEATRRCLQKGDIDPTSARKRPGVSLGTLCGSMDVAEQSLRTVHGAGFAEVTPSWYATGLPSATSAIVASVHDMKGPNLTVLGHHAGIDAIIFGCRQILAERASAMLAGGFDVPNESFLARFHSAPEYAEVTVHGGAGLVWLEEDRGLAAGMTAIVGWSQGILDERAFQAGELSQLLRLAAGGIPLSTTPVVHRISPARHGAVDYLAATSVIYLVESVIDSGAPGLHALCAKGFGPSVSCLLLEKSSS
jgi:3-oxoacyl-[acyl-carrier-protein] synthase II